MLANGLRDLVEAIGPALEWARKYCFISASPGETVTTTDGDVTTFSMSRQIDAAAWARLVGIEAKRFDRLTLPEKFARLQRDYGWPLPASTPHVLTLNAARNCLVHRGGVVGLADLKDPSDSGLTLRWKQMELIAGREGEEMRTLAVGSRIEVGDAVKLRVGDGERIVPLGTRLEISEAEYLSFAWTFMVFGLQVQESCTAIRPPDSVSG